MLLCEVLFIFETFTVGQSEFHPNHTSLLGMVGLYINSEIDDFCG